MRTRDSIKYLAHSSYSVNSNYYCVIRTTRVKERSTVSEKERVRQIKVQRREARNQHESPDSWRNASLFSDTVK